RPPCRQQATRAARCRAGYGCWKPTVADYASGWRRRHMADTKKRQSASSIKINPNLRCLRIYPVEDAKNQTKSIADLKTVGIKLSREQAIHLARVLLAAAQDWDEVDLTAWRVYKRQS